MVHWGDVELSGLWTPFYTHSLIISLVKSEFSNLSVYQNHLEVLLKHKLLGSSPQVLIQKVGGGAWEFAFHIIPRWCWRCLSGNHTLRMAGLLKWLSFCLYIRIIWETLMNSNARTLSAKRFISGDLGWSSEVGIFKKLSRWSYHMSELRTHVLPAHGLAFSQGTQVGTIA